MRLSHNMFSLNIYQTYKGRLAENSKASNNISTGQKINSAKDNPEKIGRNERLKINVLSNNAISQNIQDTNSMIQTFDGSLQEINNNLSRLKELTVKAGSGTLTDSDQELIQGEMDSILADIRELGSGTEFNGIKLSDLSVTDNSNPNTRECLVGNMVGEKVKIPSFNLSPEMLGIDNLKANKSQDDPATNFTGGITAVNNAIILVGKIRSEYGAMQTNLEETQSNLSDITLSVGKAQSNIGDSDIAKEMLEYSRTNILIQSSIGLMAQSNNFPKDALKVLERL